MKSTLITALVLATGASMAPAQNAVSFELKRDNTPSGGSIVSGDFNQDAKPDLVYVAGTDVTLRLGNGDGTFRQPANIGVADSPGVRDIATGDFDRDGFVDFAVACPGGTFDVFFGNAGGTFAVPVRVATQGSPESITAGDFNGDGLMDLAIGDSSGQLEIYNNVNRRSFVLKNATPIGAEVISVRAGDFNNDGVQSLGVATHETAYVWWNDGHENFTQKTLATYPLVSGAGDNLAGLSVGDLNQDGMADIIVSFDCDPNNDTPGRSDPTPCQGLTAFYGQGLQRFFERKLVNYTHAVASYSVQTADTDSDGLGDLVTASQEGGLNVWRGHPDGSYDQTPVSFLTTSEGVGPLALGDFNRDGMIDVVMPMSGVGQTQFFLNATARTPYCAQSNIDPTVTACAPVDNTYLPGPNLVVLANATDSKQVTSMQVYINGSLKFSNAVTSFGQDFPLSNGAYFLVFKAWDSTGRNFRTQRHLTMYTGTPGVVCPAPQPGSANLCIPVGTPNQTSPVHLVGNGYATSIPTSAQLYVDGHLTIEDRGCTQNGGCPGGTSSIDTYLPLSPGTHELYFKLWEANGGHSTVQRFVTVK